MEITFQGEIYNLSHRQQLEAVIGLIKQIETEIRENITEYRGTENFKPNALAKVFQDKKLKLNEQTERAKGDEQFVANKDWYVFNANYGTGEEKAFVRMLDLQMDELRKKYDGIYLIRNERHFKIFNFSDGQAFEPDFILFLKEKNGKFLTYQVFIENKGKQLRVHEKGKETS